MMFGYWRGDAGVILPEYVEQGILEEDPFQVLDREGVGKLVERWACSAAAPPCRT